MLSIESLNASPQRFDWSRVEGLHRLIVEPEPTESELSDVGFSPEALREAGHDVPHDEEGAAAYAIAEFKRSQEYDDWRDGLLPAMSVLWPCKPSVEARDAAQAFKRENLACTLVSGFINGVEVSGIALIGGGMDLSDHIAAAYILCGHVPPACVIESALSHSSPKMAEELAEAAQHAAEALDLQAGRIKNALERKTTQAYR